MSQFALGGQVRAAPCGLMVNGLTKSFGEITAAKDITLCAHRARITCLIGPNGAGKSTTFRMIVGLLSPDSGSVTWDGGQSPLKKEAIGFLPEERGLYSDQKVEDLLRYWARLRLVASSEINTRVQYWLERFDLCEKRRKTLRTLSKGNQQKVQLAACLIHNPQILVLDEPFSGLDPLNQELVCAILQEFKDKGAAILLSAHQLSIVEQVADTVHIFRDGEIVSTLQISIAEKVKHMERDLQSWRIEFTAEHTGPVIECLSLMEDGHIAQDHDPASGVISLAGVTPQEFAFLMGRISAVAEVRKIVEINEALHQHYINMFTAKAVQQ